MNAKPDHAHFEGIDNFRDFGGYSALEGAKVRTGRLYRSAHHARATDEDLERLLSLKLAVIVDLRRPDERQRDPSRRPDLCQAHVVMNDIGQSTEDAYLRFLKTSDLSVEAMRRFHVAYYRDAPFERRHIDLYSRYFQALSTAEGAALIHCAAGKDRTGLLAALTHHLLGVSYEDTLEDYLKTNDPVRIERRLEPFRAYVIALTGRTPSDDAMRAAMSVEAIYLETALGAIEEASGSVDAYLEGTLGVTRALRQRLRDQLLA